MNSLFGTGTLEEELTRYFNTHLGFRLSKKHIKEIAEQARERYKNELGIVYWLAELPDELRKKKTPTEVRKRNTFLAWKLRYENKHGVKLSEEEAEVLRVGLEERKQQKIDKAKRIEARWAATIEARKIFPSVKIPQGFKIVLLDIYTKEELPFESNKDASAFAQVTHSAVYNAAKDGKVLSTKYLVKMEFPNA